MTEADIMRSIMIEMSKLGHRLFRNNVGALKDARGRLVRFGLGVGTSDLIGFTSTGRFLAIEVKRPGENPTDAQCAFIWGVNKFGGIAFTAHSADEAIKLIGILAG